jgi:hypothetical protein
MTIHLPLMCSMVANRIFIFFKARHKSVTVNHYILCVFLEMLKHLQIQIPTFVQLGLSIN